MNLENNVNSNSLRILYWNARSINRRKRDLPILLKDTDIFLCVESWLSDSGTSQDSVFVPGFVQLQKNRSNSRGGGILIMMRKFIAFKEIHIDSPHPSIELCKVRLTNTNLSLDIVVCYRAPGILSQEIFDDLISKVDNNIPSIFVGDFNSHNIIWNSVITDNNGEKLANSIYDHNLFLHNPDTFTRVNPSDGSHSNIDLAFSTLNIAEKIHINVLDETLGSDHYPIRCLIDLDKNMYKKKSFKIKTKRTNWEKFTENLNSNFDSFLTSEFSNLSAEKKYEIFTDNVINSLKMSTPIKKPIDPSKYKNPVPWWDAEYDKVKRFRKAAYKK